MTPLFLPMQREVEYQQSSSIKLVKTPGGSEPVQTEATEESCTALNLKLSVTKIQHVGGVYCGAAGL
ncbi:unnamed protein product [Boreogadus saida]